MKRSILLGMACLSLSLSGCGDQSQESTDLKTKPAAVKAAASPANPQSKPQPPVQQCVDTKGKPIYCPAAPGPWSPWGPWYH